MKNGQASCEMEQLRSKVRSDLEEMCQRGVGLFVDNRVALPEEAAAVAVREDSPYMADYVLDETGSVAEVHFDCVTQR